MIPADFLRAARSANLRYFHFGAHPNREDGTPFLRLVVRRFVGTEQEVYLPVPVRVTNYQPLRGEPVSYQLGDPVYPSQGGYLLSFLRALRPASELSFKLTLFNQTPALDAIRWVSHRLVGVIGEREYLLFEYTGPADSLASPVRLRTPETLTA